jgi:hypothetical protein
MIVPMTNLSKSVISLAGEVGSERTIPCFKDDRLLAYPFVSMILEVNPTLADKGSVGLTSRRTYACATSALLAYAFVELTTVT